MKKIIFTLTIWASFTIQTLAQSFQSGDLLYSIISTNPLCISLNGHVDSTNAQGELVIPETIEHEGIVYTVTEIGDRGFLNCSGLTGILSIPETVKVIGEHAFSGCSGFSELKLSDGLIEIHERAFMNCTGFTGTLDIPETVMYIKYGAFCNCSGFSGDLIIPNSVVELGTTLNDYWDTNEDTNSSFANCFDHLVLPESLDSIGAFCFFECSRLCGDLVIPNSVRGIKYMAFRGCSGFDSLTLGNSLGYIGYEAFEGCTGFKGTLIIPESVTTVRSGAFSGCSGLEHIVLSSNIQIDGQSMGLFSVCTSLSSIDIPEGWTRTGMSTFSFCTSLTEVHFPESLEKIDDNAFENCRSLTKLDFPKKLKQIGHQAFSDCVGLSGELVVPSQVESILPYAFDSCYSINRLVLGDSIKLVCEWAFRNTGIESIVVKSVTPPELLPFYYVWSFPDSISITVPCSTEEAYHSSEFWNRFTNLSEGNTLLLSTVAEDDTMGEVIILKEANCSDMCVKVEAVPSDGYVFLYWGVDGEHVSSENPYSFELTEDVELVAHFSGLGLGETMLFYSIHPNPTNGTFTVTGKDLKQAEVINTLGQQVATAKGQSETLQIDIAKLPAGVYFVRITDGEGRKCVRKVVKE